jgi:hypothetical protein
VGRYQKFPHGDNGKYRVRDYEGNGGKGKWVSDGNGRQQRLDEESADDLINKLEERTDD